MINSCCCFFLFFLNSDFSTFKNQITKKDQERDLLVLKYKF